MSAATLTRQAAFGDAPASNDPPSPATLRAQIADLAHREAKLLAAYERHYAEGARICTTIPATQPGTVPDPYYDRRVKSDKAHQRGNACYYAARAKAKRRGRLEAELARLEQAGAYEDPFEVAA